MAHILLVEDDDSVRAFTARALQIDGHTVDQADDGDIGLEKAAAKGGGYDLVLSDIRMPTMDGIEMAKELAKAYPDLKILLMTGYAEQREVRAQDWEGVPHIFRGVGDMLLRNDGGTFTDVSEEAGIYGSLIGFGLGVLVSDFNQAGVFDDVPFETVWSLLLATSKSVG